MNKEQFTISEMQEMQKALQEKYKDKWEPICAEIGQNKLLWMIGEIGEVIDIVKKTAAKMLVPIHRSATILLKKWQTYLCILTMLCFAMELPKKN